MNVADGSMNPASRAERQRERPTIGVVLADTVEVWELFPWQGAEDVARERDVNLLAFAGGELKVERRFWVHANVIYDLMTPECMDGFMIGTGAFDSRVGPEGTGDFCARHRPLPVVTIEHAVSGLPGVLLDDYQSMRQVIAHLIEVHDCRRIAYIGDPSASHLGFRTRYRAYAEALRDYGLPFDPDLVCSRWEDEAALVSWFAERASGIDALTGQEDAFVLAGMHALQSLGVRVPGDVAVVGFNDLMESRVSTPPLTTVRLPFYEMGRRVAETLLALLSGEQIPEQEVLAGQLAVRQSCGCVDPLVTQAAVGPVERTGEALETALSARREKILAEMAQAVTVLPAHVDAGCSGRLLDAFVAALMAGSPESPGLFLRELDDVLRQAMVAEDDPLSGSGPGLEAWHGVISALHRHTWPYLDDEALVRGEDLGQQARVMIAEATRQAQAYRALQVERWDQTLYEIGEALITTFDVDELMDVLAAQLPRLGIPSCYLSLYKDPRPYEYPQPAPEWSRLVLAYTGEDAGRAGGRVELEPGGRPFRSRELIPEGMWPEGRRYSFLVEPLHFREHQLGFALFEVGPREGTVYSTLRVQISSALRGALLLEERKQAGAALEKAYTAVEQQVQERTAELERESAEREWAQQESVRLQQEVIEAQRQALLELSTPIIPVMELPQGGSVIVVPLIGNIDKMRARDIMRQLLEGIREHRAKVIILDVTGVPMVDTEVADHLYKTIQAARLKGARTIVTGISDAVAETIVDLGIDWSGITMLGDLQSGLQAVLKANMDSGTRSAA
jgi:DNA-binding LacI/PurR family transcriptional regulator/anti-anti-sigma regulatory factor